jgi:uncharacterized protein YjiS (DUF1127 family)
MRILTGPNETAFAGARAASEIDQPALLYRLWRGIVRTLAIRHLRRGLHAMPDWLLHDLGLRRSDISTIAVRIVDGCDHWALPERAQD